MTPTHKRTPGAVLYTRVSTGEQAEHGTSLDSQRDACRAKALALSLPIVAEYEDAGVSGGFLLSRPGMQSALADIAAGRADTLICANLSRFSRDTEHQQAIKKAVRSAGGRLVFCDMDFDDTPEGDLAFGIMGGFAQYEKAVIRERTMKGRRKQAQQGQQPTRSRSPFGYHVVTKADVLRGLYPAEQLGRHQIIPEEAACVREIFARYASGAHSLNDIAKWLNQSAVPTKRGGAYWRATALRVILRNSAYRGEAVFGRTSWHVSENRLAETNPITGENFRCAHIQTFTPEEDWVTIECPPLVPADLWEQANARLTENKRQHGGNPWRTRMLSGLVACAHCGRPMVACNGSRTTRRGKTYHNPDRYYCGHDRRTFTATGAHPCSPTHYLLEQTEQAVLLALGEICARPEVVRFALETYSRQAGPAPSRDVLRAELSAVDKSLAGVKQQEAAAVQAQIAGIIAGASPDAYAEAFASLAARRKDLEDERGRLSAQIAPSRAPLPAEPLDTETLTAQVLTDIHAVLTSPLVAGQKKRSLVRTVVEKVVCQKEGADVFFRDGAGIAEAIGADTLQFMLPKCASRCSPSETALRS